MDFWLLSHLLIVPSFNLVVLRILVESTGFSYFWTFKSRQKLKWQKRPWTKSRTDIGDSSRSGEKVIRSGSAASWIRQLQQTSKPANAKMKHLEGKLLTESQHH